MKNIATLILVSTLTFSTASHADEGWFDSFKNMIGLGDKTEEVAAVAEASPNMDGMISAITQNLGVSSSQAEGGLGSIMSYVKDNVSSDKFSQLSSTLPGIDQVLSAVPAISSEEGGMAGLLSKAAEYNDTLKGLNDMKKQFEALGLSPEMITGFIEQAQAYLNTPQGQEARKVLTESLSNFI
ncbi:MAG: hypothetical protein ACI9O6_000744 [Glaciecola sp.]|jgi:hypothetical protein